MSEAKVWKPQADTVEYDWARIIKGKASHRHQWLQSPPVYRVALVQLVVCLIFSLASLSMGTDFVFSALLGGLCCAVPNAYFIGKAFRHRGARSAKQIVSSFYRGEAGKLILTTVGFILVFTQVKSVEPLALFGSFVAVQSVSWFAPLLIKRQ